MSDEKKHVKSAMWYTASSVLAKGFVLLLTPIYARIMMPNEYGIYNTFISWLNILAVVLSIDLSTSILRAKFDYSEHEFNNYLYSVVVFSVLYSVFAIGVIGGIISEEKLSSILGLNFKYIQMLALVLVFHSMIPIFQAEQRAEIRYKVASFVTVLSGLTAFLFPVAMSTIMDNALNAVLSGYTMNAILWGCVVFLYYVTKRKAQIKIKYIKYALAIAIPVIPHILSGMVMGNSDKIMINDMCGSEYAARYGLINTCALVISLFRNAINNAWLPWYYQKLTERDYMQVRNISRMYIDVFSIGCVLLCLLGPELVYVLGGETYSQASILVPLIMLGCYYNYIYLFYVNIEFFEKRTIGISIITITTSVLNIILNYIGIRMYGYTAAAITTAICNGLTVLLHYMITRKMNNKIICDNIHILKRCIYAVFCVIACLMLYEYRTVRYLAICLLICIIGKVFATHSKQLFRRG